MHIPHLPVLALLAWILDSQAATLMARPEEDYDVILRGGGEKLVLPTQLSSTITSCLPCEAPPLSRVKGLRA